MKRPRLTRPAAHVAAAALPLTMEEKSATLAIWKEFQPKHFPPQVMIDRYQAHCLSNIVDTVRDIIRDEMVGPELTALVYQTPTRTFTVEELLRYVSECLNPSKPG